MNEKEIYEVYSKAVNDSGFSGDSTMPDRFIRETEFSSLLKIIYKYMGHSKFEESKILEIGCGNGYIASRLLCEIPRLNLLGTDVNKEMISLAKSRNLNQSEFIVADCRELQSVVKKQFDLIYSIRCLINLVSWQDQEAALKNIEISLKPGGYIVLLEAFIDGHEKYNEMRKLFDLPHYPFAPQNLYLELSNVDLAFKSVGLEYLQMEDLSDITHHLSSHYLSSRVLNDAFGPNDKPYLNNKNSNLIRGLSELISNRSSGFSPLQVHIWKKPATK